MRKSSQIEALPVQTHPPDSPASANAERAVLGAILLKPVLFAVCSRVDLRPDDFSIPANADIFRALQHMAAQDKPIDMVLLSEEIDVARLGGMAYIASLTEGAVAVEANVEACCRVIRRKAALRLLICVAVMVMRRAREHGADPTEIANWLKEQVARRGF